MMHKSVWSFVGQTLVFFHGEVFHNSSFLMSELRIVKNFRIAATNATFFSFPSANKC